MGGYSKLSIQFQKDDQKPFDSNFCDKKKLLVLKPELPRNPLLKQVAIDDLVEFKRKY